MDSYLQVSGHLVWTQVLVFVLLLIQYCFQEGQEDL